MYWLRWHYHVKDITGAPYKIKKKSKQNDRIAGRQRHNSYTVQYSHDCLVIVKRRPEKYSLQLATKRRQRWCIPDRWWQAVPHTCRSHWEGTVTECWTYGGRYHQHGWASRAQTTSSIDVRCPVQAVSKVRRRCSMKTAVGKNAQPECDLLHSSQPMEFTKQWGYAFWPLHWENQTGGGIQDRL